MTPLSNDARRNRSCDDSGLGTSSNRFVGENEMPTPPSLRRVMLAPGSFFSQHEIETGKMARYAAAMKAGETFPPVVVARYGEKVMPIDGHHRLAAAAAVNVSCDAWECDGEEFEDFCIEVGSADGDRLLLASVPQRPTLQP